MKESIEFGGAVFNEHTNWSDIVRHPYGFLTGPGERDLDGASALGALAEALHGTRLEAGLADAALEVIELGEEPTMDWVDLRRVGEGAARHRAGVNGGWFAS